MTRSLVLTVVLAFSCVGVAAGAFLAGRSSGPDLTVVARAGTSAGARSGARAGARSGHHAGYRAGYEAGYKHAYARAYRTAYLHGVGRS